MTLLLFVLGGVLLVYGADLMVSAASRLAEAVGVPPLVVGLTVVALGTSAPEVAVSVRAAAAGTGDIAVGNVVGSNIANVLLILGVSAVVIPLRVAPQLLSTDAPVMIAAAGLLAWFASDGVVSRAEGAVLLAGLAAYLGSTVWAGLREGAAEAPEPSLAAHGTAPPDADGAAPPVPPVPAAKPNFWLQPPLLLLGLGMLVIGAGWLVDGAVAAAKAMGVSELIIGLTIVAVGTSLPELATSAMAGLRGERDIAVGNVVGSNILNVLCVMGAAAAVAPAGSPGIPVARPALAFDVPVMMAVSLACLPVFYVGRQVYRWEGALFLGYYAAYTAYLILDSAGHDALPLFSWVMVAVVMPLTAATMIAAVAWEFLRPHGEAA
jgi:cation:H+ antiporter